MKQNNDVATIPIQLTPAELMDFSLSLSLKQTNKQTKYTLGTGDIILVKAVK